MAIAIVPCLFMSVIAARGEKFVQHCRQILLQTRLEFNRPHRAGTPDVEHVRYSSADMRLTHDLRNRFRQIVHLPMPACPQLYLSLINHQLELPQNHAPGIPIRLI
jgi:hypothetical protein